MARYARYYKFFSLGVAGGTALALTKVIPLSTISPEQDRKLRNLGLKVLPYDAEESNSLWGAYWDRCKPVAEDLKPVTGTVNLLFVRHGEEVFQPETGQDKHSDRGLDQVAHIGQRLLRLNFPYTWVNTCIYNSAKDGSQESANIITSYLPEVRMEHDDLLQDELEVASGKQSEAVPSPLDDLDRIVRMEAAFQKYVRCARADQVGDTYKVIVCHGDVMQYIVNRALEHDASSAERFQKNQNGLVMLSVLPDGRVKLLDVDEDPDHMTTESTADSPMAEQSLQTVLKI